MKPQVANQSLGKPFESDRKVLGRRLQLFEMRIEDIVKKGIKGVLILMVYLGQRFNEVSRRPTHPSFFSHNQTRIDANFHCKFTGSVQS